ncbi:MAG: hypothetical protein HY747_00075 [Elusimicrobia bacterium]|nr:hypothetical protein [Elusimicrobiota bacterium]
MNKESNFNVEGKTNFPAAVTVTSQSGGAFSAAGIELVNDLGSFDIFHQATPQSLVFTGNISQPSSYFTVSSLGNVGMGNVPLASYKLNVAGQINASAGLCMNGDCRASWTAATQEVDGIIGNEIADTANATLLRSGSGTLADPYRLALNLANPNTWSAPQAFNGGADMQGKNITNLAYPANDSDAANKNYVDNQVATLAAIPNGMIAMFDTGCPSGWTRFDALDGRFPRGNTTAGGTGGANQVTVPGHTHTILEGQSGSNWSDLSAGGGNGNVPREHGHAPYSLAAGSVTFDILPQFRDIVFCKKN